MKTKPTCDICKETKPLKTDYHKGKALGKLCNSCLALMKWANHDSKKIQRLMDYRFPGHRDAVTVK